MLRFRILAALVCLLLAPLRLLAQPLAESVPADALIYVGWAGSAALTPQYEKSNLKGFLAASTLPEFVAEQVPALLAKATQDKPEDAENIKKVLAAAGPMWKHPVAFYFGPLDWTNPQKPMPRIALICAAGPDAPALAETLKELPKQQNADEPPVEVTVVGDRVILTIGKLAPGTADMLSGKAGAGGAGVAGALPARAEFKAAMTQVGGAEGSAYGIYLDVAGIFQEVDKAMAADKNDEESKTKARLVIDLLGVRGITQVAATGGFAGANWSERGFMGVVAGKPRTGLLSLLDAKPVDDAMLRVVPQTAWSFNAARLDLGAAFAKLRDGIKKIDEKGFQAFQDGLAKAKEAIGLDIEKDIIAPLGDQWVLYRAQPEGLATGGFVVVHTLRDAATFANTLTKLEELVTSKGLPYP
ncbi:MAG: hypothetical protein WCI73_11320, partial [Phycisphaerae bacterium]